MAVETRDGVIFLILIVSLSFIIHVAPAPFLPTAPLYQLDSWLTIEQVSLYNSGDDISYIPLLDYPSGKYINEQGTLFSWRPFNALFYTLFTDETDPVLIFNTLGVIHPILFSLFIIILFVFCNDLFNVDIALAASAITAFTPSMLFNDVVYGSFDHHLFEVIFGTIFLLSVAGVATSNNKKSWYAVSAVACAIFGWLNTPVFTVYLIPGLLIVGLMIIRSIVVMGRNILYWLIAVSSVMIFLIFFLNIDIFELLSILAFQSSNAELTYSLPTIALGPALLIMIALLLLKFYNERNWDCPALLVCIAFLPLLAAACLFIRAEMLIAPMLALFIVISSYILFRKQFWYIVIVIVVISIVLSIGASVLVVTTANNNNALSEGLQFLNVQPSGVVASWMGDSGFWILTIANKSPMVDPSANPGSEQRVTEIFNSDNGTADLLRQNNVSYVIISDSDCGDTGIAYYRWACRKDYVGNIIWDKKGIIIYEVD
ncbi:hypothetical protein M0R72_15350 [Candidatus Pacearchaeota archaeon]|jgi:hypothetical protein|nr:hypothetical protein [Candidatus Pacearchaeota archaeon]